MKNNLHLIQGEKRIYNSCLVVSQAGGFRLIPIHDILYLNSSSNYTFIHLYDGSKILASKTMKYIAAQLPSRLFLKVHQSYYVGIEYIRGISLKKEGKVILSPDIEIPISRSRRTTIRKMVRAGLTN